MQTSKWMSYSDSSHFSDKNSYKTLFISSYELKDMNLASFKHLQEFSENRYFAGTFLTEGNVATVAAARDQAG
jgi:hypothetical protein